MDFYDLVIKRYSTRSFERNRSIPGVMCSKEFSMPEEWLLPQIIFSLGASMWSGHQKYLKKFTTAISLT